MAKAIKKGRFELHHLSPSLYKEMPWKNGMGVSHEIYRDPPGQAEFKIRLSTSKIELRDVPIPFSSYPGLKRVLVVTDGGELITNHGVIRKNEALTFDGDQEIQAHPQSSSAAPNRVHDLNLIYDPKSFEVETHILTVDKKPKSYSLDPLEMFFFGLDDHAKISFYPGELKLTLKKGETIHMKQTAPDPLEPSSMLVERESGGKESDATKFVFAAFGITRLLP